MHLLFLKTKCTLKNFLLLAFAFPGPTTQTRSSCLCCPFNSFALLNASLILQKQACIKQG